MADTIAALEHELAEIIPRRHRLLMEEEGLHRSLRDVRAQIEAATDPEARVRLHAEKKRLEARVNETLADVSPLIDRKLQIERRLKLLRRSVELSSELAPAVEAAAGRLVELRRAETELVRAITEARLAMDRVHRSAERVERPLNQQAQGWARVVGDLAWALRQDHVARETLNLDPAGGPPHADHSKHAADLLDWASALTTT